MMFFTLISIHAPHARSDFSLRPRFNQPEISIHAPHARSDLTSRKTSRAAKHFNPRSSCEERLDCVYRLDDGLLFQSTLLMRGATRQSSCSAPDIYFNPRSSCEERLELDKVSQGIIISIHAPHARSYPNTVKADMGEFEFQSTLLMRGATRRAESRRADQ